MRERTVSESIPQRAIVTALPHVNVYDAACRMTEARCGSIVVVDRKGSMLGILTERDVMTKVVARALLPADTLVSDIMTPEPRCASPDMLVSDAVMIMKLGGFRHLPIVSKTSKLLGVFSIRDASAHEIIDADGRLEDLDKVCESLGY